jgi:uncharacterized protein (TIGR02145 family)
MVKNRILFFIFLVFGVATNAQKVSNISFKQEQSNIIVSYDLETKTTCKIDLFVSTNGGATWQGPLKKVIGDVGAKVNTGKRSITWNVLEEFEYLRGNNILFQVRADSFDSGTVEIGSQIWMKKNLDVSTYKNGDVIPEVKDPNEWLTLKTGAWCYYNNDSKNGKIYGKLYNWYAVNDPRGLAPEGFHIPTMKEINFLLGYLGGSDIAGYKLKEAGTAWNPPNIYVNNSNSSGFTALPGGCRSGTYGGFEGFGWIGKWWYVNFSNSAGFFSLMDYTNVVPTAEFTYESFGLSLRCIKD